MLLSFPEYFDVNEFWLDSYKPFFVGLFFVLSSRFFYSASGYYVSAYKSINSNSIDIPIALGIIIMFIRSTIDIIFNYGSGFLIA
jgi:Cu+-exporting ATPase